MSLRTTLSASAIVVEVALVLPSTILSSAAVLVTPSRILSSAAVDAIAVLPKVNPPSGTTIPLPELAVKVFAVNLKSSAPAILTSIWSSVSAVMLVSPSASKISSVPFKSESNGPPTAPDNSSYSASVRAFTELNESGEFTSSVCTKLVDVTSTSNVKVKFRAGADGIYTTGNSNASYTYITFQRYGDT